MKHKLTIGQRLADMITSFAGSWRFIGIFSFCLLFWVMINCNKLIHANFDPYPFILLNLLLSCIAAIQAPIILMSQSRQNEKDREIFENDYNIDRESHLILRELDKKIDKILKKKVSKE